MNTEDTIKKINEFTKQFIYYEFSIYHYSKEKLIVVGSPDISYYHNLEIHLNDLFYVQAKCTWIADTNKPVVQSLNDAELIEFNKENKIEVGYNTIKFLDRDCLKHFYSFDRIELSYNVTKYY